jgi:hypothetical protein
MPPGQKITPNIFDEIKLKNPRGKEVIHIMNNDSKTLSGVPYYPYTLPINNSLEKVKNSPLSKLLKELKENDSGSKT